MGQKSQELMMLWHPPRKASTLAKPAARSHTRRLYPKAVLEGEVRSAGGHAPIGMGVVRVPTVLQAHGWG